MTTEELVAWFTMFTLALLANLDARLAHKRIDILIERMNLHDEEKHEGR